MSRQTVHQCFSPNTPLGNVKRCVKEGHMIMIIMRGLPGSGKSTLAEQLHGVSTNGVIYSTDASFVSNGVYNWDPNKLQEYHQKNQIKARDAMVDGFTPVIVDNANICFDHMKPYILHALKNFYEIYIIEPDTPWKFKPIELARTNVHNTPKHTIERMKDEYEMYNEHTFKRILDKAGYSMNIQPPMLAEDEVLELNLHSKPIHASSSASKNGEDNSGEKPTHLDVSLASIPSNIISSKHCTPFAALFMGPPPGIAAPVSNLFSLSPVPRPFTTDVICREMGTQTTEAQCALISASVHLELDDIIGIGENVTITRSTLPTKVPPVTRSIDTSDFRTPHDLDILMGIFPGQQFSILEDAFLKYGLTDTIRLFTEAKFAMILNPNIEVANFCEDEDKQVLSETLSNGLRLPIRPFNSLAPVDNSPLLKSTSHTDQSLSTSYNIDPNQEYFDVDISEQMGLLMESIFNTDDGTAPFMGGLARIPKHLLKQIYSHIKGLAVEAPSDQYGSCGSSGIESSPNDSIDTYNDAKFAREIQRQCDEEDNRHLRPRVMKSSEKISLNQLKDIFPGLDPMKVEELFESARYDFRHARQLCNLFINPDFLDEIDYNDGYCEKAENFQNSYVYASPKQKGERLAAPVRKFVDFASAQTAAQKEREIGDEWMTKARQESQKIHRHTSHNTRQAIGHFTQLSNEYKAKAADHYAIADEIIASVNKFSDYLDLHQMSVQAAIESLKEKLYICDRPVDRRYGSSGRKLRVITGHGRDTGSAKIKPAIESYLKSKSYKYFFTNLGEVEITCF